LNLCFFCGRGGDIAKAGRLGDLADGEREVVRHGRGSRDDDHLVRLRSRTHTPYLACHCRRKLVGSLPRGMPKIVDCWQIGAQAMNLMVTTRILSRFIRREGVIPTSSV
jgi:hypothetical protein